jgi:poly(ADP-ribose) glycohydrolase
MFQEEIRFIIAPETLISCLLCERMRKDEAIIIMGAQQYSNYSGYQNSFKFEKGRVEQKLQRFVFGLFN